jgi:hypothetical protein
MNRKAFIGLSVRLGVLGLAALLTGVFLSRNQVVTGSECGTAARCHGCVKLDRCKRPEAKKERGDEER